MNVAGCIQIEESSQVAAARREAASIAQRLGFSEVEAGQVSIVAMELASNILKHAGEGKILLKSSTGSSLSCLDIYAIDRGPGMTDAEACFVDGYSTAGSAGTGIGAVTRLAHGFDFYTRPSLGTSIVASFYHGEPEDTELMRVEGFSVPAAGENESGDSWVVRHYNEGSTILTVDGLGHGEFAARAAKAAIDAFDGCYRLPPTEIIEILHAALQGTRGAAVAVADINEQTSVVRFSGIGNIAGVLISGQRRRNAVSLSGIVGASIRTIREFTYEWSADSLLILHSDGLTSRWDLDAYPGLRKRSEKLIASVLYRDFARGRDDATVIAAKSRRTGL